MNARPLRALLALAAIAAVLTACAPAEAPAPEITTSQAWVRAPQAGRDVTAAFVTIANAGGPDRLLAARLSGAARVELHRVEMVDDVMRMRAADAMDVPAKGRLAFVPGGDHMMAFGFDAAARAGDVATLTLVFERAGEVTLEAPLREEPPAADHHGAH